MEKLGVAMAGFGKGARIYNAPVVSSVPSLEIRSIMTSSKENMQWAKRNYPKAQLVSEFKDILDDPVIDLVIITTPNHLHHPLAKAAISAGKHVVVEKPFTTTIKEADELIKLSKKQNKILSIHHNRRWDSGFLSVQKLLKEQKIGIPLEYEAHFDRFRPEVNPGWKEQKHHPGSGLLYDLGSHLIDQALVLFGEPDEVYADLRIQREGSEVTDNFQVLLYYPALRVSLKAGMFVKEKGPTYAVHGTKGSFLKYGDDPQEEALKRGIIPSEKPDWGRESEENWGKLNTFEEEKIIESERGDYPRFYQNISQTILGREKLSVIPEAAREVIKVIEYVQQSNAEKRRIVYKKKDQEDR